MGLKQRLKLIFYSLEFRLFRLSARVTGCLHGGFDDKRFLMVEGDPLPIVKLPNPNPGSGSYYFVSPHKCGSVLIGQIARALATANHMPYVDISTQVFKVGEGEHSAFTNLGTLCAQPGYVHGTFRTKLYINLIPDHAKTVVLIRDPRDAIVSKYYSDTKSHTVKGNAYNKKASDDFLNMRKTQQTLNIDEAAGTYIDFYLSQFDAIERLIQRSAPGSVKLYRYEDVIFNKREWILDMAAFMGWQISPVQLEKLLSRVDILPDAENQNQHIRQVRPGNYKQKLRPETQETLTRAFAGVLTRYRYTED
jgi:hypothetical protein